MWIPALYGSDHMSRGRTSTGCIRVRGDFQFRASVEIEGREKSKTFTTRIEAEDWIKGLLESKAEGRSADWLKARTVTLADGLRRYLAEITPHKKSADTETRNIEAFLAREQELGKKPLYDLSTGDLKALINRRMAPDDPSVRAITGSTMNRELAFVSHLFTVARAEWDFQDLENPVVLGLRRKENRARDRRLEEGEEDALLAAARAYERDCDPEIPITAVIQVAIDTAMRQGELGKCLWKHVNLREATILLPDTKNGSARTVPLWPSTARLLAGLKRREDGLVFGPTASIRQMWTRVLKRAGLKNLRFHDLRHEGTSRLFERTDLTDVEIASVTGHKTLAMLQSYAHLRANKIARKLAAFEQRVPLQAVSSGA